MQLSRVRFGIGSVFIGGLLCAGLVAGSVSPVWASDGDAGTGSVVVGGFGLGDGLEGSVDERDGSFTFGVGVGGLQLSWTSRSGDDRWGLGPHWGLGLAAIETKNGVLVHPPNGAGTSGAYRPDPTHPSGLAGYGVQDLVFEQRTGVLDGRLLDPVIGLPGVDGAEVEYAFVLEELGGTVTYFAESGNPAVRVTAEGERTDWLWSATAPNRLAGVVNPDGVVTALDWDSEPGAILVTQGANLPGELDPVTEERGELPVWRLELDGGQLSRIVDPSGGVVHVDYDDTNGLLHSVHGVSGASTEVAWRTHFDGTVRVDQVRTVDSVGAELSKRTWAPAGERTSSGWPHYDDESDLFWSGDPAFRYQTVLSDGATRVVSEYNSLGTLVGREMLATTPSGEQTLQEQEFVYPETADGGTPDPAALPGNWSRPVQVATVYRDLQGATRTSTESYEFDAVGRQVSYTAADGSVTTSEYDDDVPEGARLPIGITTSATVTAPDGLVRETRQRVNDARTAVVAIEQFEGRIGEELTPTSREEFDVSADGVITAERKYPVNVDEERAAMPVVALRDVQIDRGAGTMSTTLTQAAGTPSEITTVEVTSLRHGELLARTDEAGNTTRTGYDQMGRVIVHVDAAGDVATSVVETAQQHGRNATTLIGASGLAVTEVRDPLGRVTLKLDNIDRGVVKPGFERRVETRAYPEPGTVETTDAWGAKTTSQQDVFGRTVRTVAPTGLVEVTVYDDVANTVTTGLTPTGRLTDAEQVLVERRDAAGRAIGSSGTRADGIVVPEIQTSYDGLGRRTHVTDQARTTEVTYDRFGNEASVTTAPRTAGSVGPAAHDVASAGDGVLTATRGVDEFGAVVEKVLSDGSQSRSGGTLQHDELGRVITKTDQLGRVSTISYTPDGLVSSITAGNGQLTVREYDAVTRELVEERVSSPVGPDVHTRYEYDPATGALQAVFDPRAPAATRISYVIDAFGNPLRMTYPDGKTIQFSYDAHGRRESTTDITGTATTLEYDAAGLPTRAIRGSEGEDESISVSYDYDAYGRVTALTRSNGTVTTFAFTSASMVEREITTDGDGSTLAERSYDYDADGNLVKRTDTDHDPESSTEAARSTTTTTTYTYDAHDRLTGSTESGDHRTTTETAYELNASGDIRAETVTTDAGGPEQSRTVRDYEYSELGELRSISERTDGNAAETRVQSYDAAGNLTEGLGGTTHEYDAANRPMNQIAADGTVSTTTYWADGTRRQVATTRDGTTTTTGFYWVGRTLLNETYATDEASDPSETGVAGYLIGASRLARTITDALGQTSTDWYGIDRHGNVTELITPDAQVALRYTYSDYGVQTLHPTAPDAEPMTDGLGRNPFGYAGEYTDPDGTQYLSTRMYDPELHRFTTMDSAELHNLYAYADLNPITKVDPTGRAGEWDWSTIMTVALFGASLVLTALNVGATIGLALVAVRAASAIAGASGAAGGVETSVWLAAGFGILMDLGSTAASGVSMWDDHISPIIDDEQSKWRLTVIEAFAAVAALASTTLAMNALTKSAKAVSQAAAKAPCPVTYNGPPLQYKSTVDPPRPGQIEPLRGIWVYPAGVNPPGTKTTDIMWHQSWHLEQNLPDYTRMNARQLADELGRLNRKVASELGKYPKFQELADRMLMDDMGLLIQLDKGTEHFRKHLDYLMSYQYPIVGLAESPSAPSGALQTVTALRNVQKELRQRTYAGFK